MDASRNSLELPEKCNPLHTSSVRAVLKYREDREDGGREAGAGERLNASAHLWEVRTTARPSLITLRMAVHKKRREWGSIPVVGSSW